MTDNSPDRRLAWEEGYRAGIEEYLVMMELSSDIQEIQNQLNEQYDNSTARTERIIQRSRQGTEE